jgi:hypothetical protein
MACLRSCGGGHDPLALRLEAESLLNAGHYEDAMQACRLGMAAVANPHKRCVQGCDSRAAPSTRDRRVRVHTQHDRGSAANPHHPARRELQSQPARAVCRRDALFLGLCDTIALRAAERGDLAVGFSGRELLVRPADPSEAWLGLPAPPGNNDMAPPTPGLLTAPTAGGGAWVGGCGPGAPSAQLLSFRSLEDALEAAADGDVITLMPGTHNVRCGGGLALARRVLIRGSQGRTWDTSGGVTGGGQLAAVVDYRGNSPLFRISRCAFPLSSHGQPRSPDVFSPPFKSSEACSLCSSRAAPFPFWG